jgi:hypothetical protein
MLNRNFDPLRGFTPPGTNTHVNLGWLQTPEEFTQDCLDTKQKPLFESWALCTQLPDEVVSVMQSALVPKASAIGMLSSAEGILYPVVTLQSAGLQVRILLCLANPDTQDWFRAVTTAGTINVSVEVPEVDQVAVISLPCEVSSEFDVEGIIDRCATPPDRECFLRDAAAMMKRLVEPEGLPSIVSGFETQELRLVVAFENGLAARATTPELKQRVLN